MSGHPKKGYERLFAGVNPTMATSSLVMVIGFVLFTVLYSDLANSLYTGAKQWIESSLGWYYIAVVSGVLFFTFWVGLSRFGNLRLGRDDEHPEFSNFSWFAMLFSAAVGTGLLFWSIAEPVMHMQGNPFMEMAGVAANTPEAAQIALRVTMFHWGLHGWCIYIIVGLILAYFTYRRGLPLTIRSALYPLLGERIYGPIGHAVDLLAIFSTLFGTATTLGLGVAQMNAGLNYMFGMEISTTSQLLLIAATSVVATLSAVSGVRKGILWLSEWNIRLSSILFLFLLLAGPTVFLLGLYATSLGDYLANFIPMGLWTDPNPERQWQGWWTIFYWGWWLSWGPFVGMFIARISRGRTVRQVVLGGMLAATLGAFLWVVIMGGTGVYLQLAGTVNLSEIANNDLTMVLYKTIEGLNVQWATMGMASLATLMIVSWFVTSADSATLVICTILSMGNENPPQRFRVIWGLGLGALAGVLLLSGGLKGLQAATIAAALPFSFILLTICYCLVRALHDEERALVSSPSVVARAS
ncbi:BCCT family transporter [Pseudomonas marincola]|uniref:BCCT family transporter n=1 Tax=Pseudomonas marincola TaxID=437900 RepID=UPI0008E47EF9|nr:BCCT family transporter [Pseudomonas marincola]SFT88156.1 choline/glycine/proline betaine transport protein [Pseudomonas marincola]